MHSGDVSFQREPSPPLPGASAPIGIPGSSPAPERAGRGRKLAGQFGWALVMHVGTAIGGVLALIAALYLRRHVGGDDPHALIAWQFIVVSAPMLVFDAVGAAFLGRFLAKRGERFARAVPTQATVVRARRKAGKGVSEEDAKPLIRYATADGVQREATPDLDALGKWPEGAVVAVRYDADEPDWVMAEGAHERSVKILGVMLGVFTLVPVALIAGSLVVLL